MIDIPDMPEGWWPERIIIEGRQRCNGKEVSLCLTMTDDVARYPHVWEANLDQIRLLLWQSQYDPKIVEMAS